jgi:hypothetical protein
MSPGERVRRETALDKLMGSHIQLAQLGQGGVLVDWVGFYNLLMDRARIADIPNPERYFIDPLSQRSQETRKMKDQMAQLEQQRQQGLLTGAVQLEKLRTAFDKYKTDTQNAIEVWKKKVEARIEYAKLGQQADIEEAKLVAPAAAKLLEGKRGQANGRAEPGDEPDSLGID